MNPRRLGRLGLPVLLVAATVTSVGRAEATVQATTVNTSTFSSTALYGPSALVGSPAGRTVPLTWTAASGGGNGNGYALSAVNIGSNVATACPSTPSGYTTFLGGASGTSFTDSTVAAGTDGTYVCYLAQTGYNAAGPPPWASAPVWTSQAAVPAAKVLIGFLATSVAWTNNNGALASGDTIAITFNQPVATASIGTISFICAAVGSNTIYLGITGGLTTCPTAASVGGLTGMTLSSFLSADGRYAATGAWSNGNATLTITVGALSVGWQSVSVAAGTGTFTPATTITSATGAVSICTTSICKPTTTTRP
jgi:hypothetical protein